ncbi:hypothetical protein PILCRDRAFT_8532 [Piloderma croceum F 1598]|uniref:Uncharacterized protein n=1 Tax=Piloderma croceum (strain F 1598) TaxID=765440 RepID=A0A0C3FB40_PILCF|nr:hypothetical protein PILCRDRAFT_8532 [Piloderma croceum F 1598]
MSTPNDSTNGITPTLQQRRSRNATSRRSTGALNQTSPIISDPDTVMENGEGKKTNGRGRGPSIDCSDDIESAPPPPKRRTPRSGDPTPLPLPETTLLNTPPAGQPPPAMHNPQPTPQTAQAPSSQDVTMTATAIDTPHTVSPDDNTAIGNQGVDDAVSAAILSSNSIANLPRIPRHPAQPDAGADSAQTPTTPSPVRQAPPLGTSARNLAIHRGLQELAKDRLDAEAAEKATQTQPTTDRVNGAPTAAYRADLTPTPPTGWPVCHGEHPLWFLVNGRQEQILKALSISEFSLVIHVANEISHDRNRSPVVANGIREAILRLFPGDTVKVLNVMPITKPKRNEDPPFAFIAYNLLPDTHRALITQCVWRTEFIRFWVYPTDEIVPAYLGYVAGLSSIEDKDDLDSAREELISLWLTDADITNAIRNIISRGRSVDDAGDQIVVDDNEVEEALRHLQVIRLNTLSKGKLPRPSLNLYINNLNYTHTQFKALKEAVSNVIYDLNLHGCGDYGPGWLCGQCHSSDHPTGLCYFNDIENDVPLSSPIVPALPKAQQPPRTRSAENSRGAPPRGRGGRGGNFTGVGRDKTPHKTTYGQYPPKPPPRSFLPRYPHVSVLPETRHMDYYDLSPIDSTLLLSV